MKRWLWCYSFNHGNLGWQILHYFLWQILNRHICNNLSWNKTKVDTKLLTKDICLQNQQMLSYDKKELFGLSTHSDLWFVPVCFSTSVFTLNIEKEIPVKNHRNWIIINSIFALDLLIKCKFISLKYLTSCLYQHRHKHIVWNHQIY